MEGEGEGFFSPLSTFPLSNLLRPSFFFPFDIKVLLTMVLDRYLRISSPFFGLSNMIMHFDVTSPTHIHCWFDLVENLFLFSWNYGVAYGHVLRASSCANEWRVGLGVIFSFDVDATSSWWKTRTMKGVRLSWSRFPLVVSHFPELSHLGDFVVSQPRFWWWTQNRLWRLLWDWKHLHICMVFNSRRWTLLLVA